MYCYYIKKIRKGFDGVKQVFPLPIYKFSSSSSFCELKFIDQLEPC